jgi:transcriptional regulator with XRE-family HTH domain
MDESTVFLHENIRFLRKKMKRTQEEAAIGIGITRSQIAGYEINIKPPVEILIKMSDYFKVSVDHLLRTDISKLNDKKLHELQFDPTQYLNARYLRILATTVSSKNEDLIEVVPEKAKAGYATGYADPDFIADLPRLSLPMLGKQKKFRVFQISGDSMLPHQHLSYIAASYIDNWNNIKSGEKHIVITRNEGVLFKVVYTMFEERNSMLLVSLNTIYKPFEIAAEEIAEVWRYELSIERTEM